MNKISKKIVALATMAAFVLTLVPAAAFAANGDVDIAESSVQTVEKNVKVNPGDTVNYTLNLNDDNGQPITAGHEADVYVWVTEGDSLVKDVTYYAEADGNSDASAYTRWVEGALVLDAYNSLTRTMSLKLAKAGTYTIHAAVVNDAIAHDQVTSFDQLNPIDPVKDHSTIEVVVPAVDTLTLTGNGNALPAWNAQNGTTLDLTDPAYLGDFVPSGSDKYVLTGHVEDELDRPIENKTFTVSTTETTIVEFYGDADTETDGYQVVTDEQGDFEIVFSMNPFSNANLTIVGEDGEYYVRIIAEKTSADDINRTLENGYVLAGNNTNPAWNVNYAWFTDAVQFEILDQKDNAVTGSEGIDAEPAASKDNPNHDKYLSIMTWPDDSDINADDLELSWDATQGVYTLSFTGDAERAAKVLVPGKYTVRVSLLSNDNATVSFYVAKFGTVQDIELDLYAQDRTAVNRVPVVLDDEVTLGQNVHAVAYYVDENGLKIYAPDVRVAATGEAVVDAETAFGQMDFATKTDEASNESLLGTPVTVMAWNAAQGKYIERELNVVKSYNAFTLEFDPTEGPVNEDNKVNVTVVKENGDKAQVYGNLEAFVVDQSNEDAKVTIEGSNSRVENGKGSFTIYSTEETTVDVRVVVADNSNDGAYAATLEYTVGKEDPLANRSVVMTIGSTDYVVNNNIVDGDAAPYIDSNWRTMVPIRALMESFDAEVVWSEADPDVVTINYDGGTQIIMNVGEETYTINGVEGEMDTVPVNNNGRVYVPVRFVAEGIGFSVTPLYDAETGLTASVVFQK